MFPGVGASEMLILAIVAVTLMGPKDLALMMRKLGRFTGKMRAMAFEFRQSFEELGRQAELEELRKEVSELKRAVALDDVRSDVARLEQEMHEHLNVLGTAGAHLGDSEKAQAEAEEFSRTLAESAEMSANAGPPLAEADAPPAPIAPMSIASEPEAGAVTPQDAPEGAPASEEAAPPTPSGPPKLTVIRSASA